MDNSKTVSTLNDLLNITNNRIQGFSKVEDNLCPQSTAVVAGQLEQLKASYAKFETLNKSVD